MEVVLKYECVDITSTQYMTLDDPEFIGQSRVDKEGFYYMVWKSNGILYRTCNKA